MNNNNDELNSYSLGGIQENNGLEPVAPINDEAETEILNMGTSNNEIPSPPIPPINNDQFSMGATVNQSNNFNIPPTYNNINPMSNNDIGVVPINDAPENNSNNKKKGKFNKLIFIIIIVLSLTAVGVGVYIMLHITNNKPVINTTGVKLKDVKIEIGSDIPTDLTYYADFNKIDPATCSIDTTNIEDTNTLNAKYKFVISCMNNKKYEGEVEIVDTTKPEVKTKDVKVNMGGKVLALDFIESCDDKTACSYAFKDENTVFDNLQKAGEYDVTIIVQDEAKNSTEVSAKLTVSDVVTADVYLNCTMSSNNKETIKLGIASSKFTKQAMKVYTYTLTDQAYQDLKNNSQDLNAVTYTDSNGKSITGTGVFDDANHTLTLTVIFHMKIWFPNMVMFQRV